MFSLGRLGDKLFFLFLALVLGLLFYVRFKYLHIPFERDEGEYAYAGSLLLHGHLPYREAYNMKFPGSYFMYALLMKAGGETIEAVRSGICLIVLLTALMAGAITHLITRSCTAAAVAAVTLLALNSTMGYNGLMANSEHFVNLFAAGGIFFMLLYFQRPRGSYLLFISGLSLCLALIMKQHGYAFGIFALLVLFIQTRHKPIYTRFRDFAFFTAGGFLPLVLLLAWLLHCGTWQKFCFLTVKYAYAYVQSGTETFSKHHTYLQIGILLLLLIVMRQKNIRFLLGWLIFSIVALSTGHYFRPHYHIMVFPALAVTAAYIYYSVIRLWGAAISNALTVLAFTLFLILHREELFTANPLSIFNKQYHNQFFAGMPAIAGRIDQLIPPCDKLSMFSIEPELYFYTRHIAASGYIYYYPFFEHQPYAQQMTDEFIREVEANPSRLFIYENASPDWNEAPRDHFNAWWLQYHKNFDLKEVYFANTDTDGRFVSGEQLKTDSTYKKAVVSFEFWMKKE